MMKIQRVCLVVLGATIGMSGSRLLPAQQMASVVAVNFPDAEVRSVQDPGTALDMPVSLSLSNVTLEVALREVVRVSGVRVAYTPAVVPVDRRVSIAAEKVALKNVLESLLRGTNARVQLSPAGRVMIVNARQGELQENGTIAGRVLDARTRRPIAGATVSLERASQSVVTGDDGSFRIAASIGEHTMMVRALGFIKKSMQVVVTEAQVQNVEVVLESNASVLNEVVVTGTVVATERKAITTPITVITAQEIERRGITNLEQFFRGEVPGVIALEQGDRQFIGGDIGSESYGAMETSQIYSRGASTLPVSPNSSPGANPLKTFVDGVELVNAAYLGAIDPQSIERIEIVTGPQAATIYGSGAMGGVMQIFTKKGSGERLDLSVSLKYGFVESNLNSGKTPSHNHRIGLSGGVGAGFSYSVNFSYNYLGHWQPGLFRRRMGASFAATHKKGDFTVAGNVNLTNGKNGTTNSGGIRGGSLVRSLVESGEWKLTSSVRPAMFVPRRLSLSRSQTMALNVDYLPSSAWQYKVTVGRNQSEFEIAPIRPGYTSLQDTMYASGNSTGYRNSVSFNTTWITAPEKFIGSSLTLGTTGSWGNELRINGCLPEKESTSFVPCEKSVNATRSSPSKSWGGFGSWRLGFAQKLFVTLGLRGESNPAYGRDHRIDWTPTNGIAYSIEMNEVTVKLLGSYGIATRPPTPGMREYQLSSYQPRTDPSQYFTRYANAELRPENSRGPQGGVEIYFGNTGALTVNHYRQKVTDLIQDLTVDSVEITTLSNGLKGWGYTEQYVNAATIRQRGWEATSAMSLGALSLKGTYTWSDSRVLSSRIPTLYPGMSFRALPSHTGSIIASYTSRSASMSLTLNYIGAATTSMGGTMVFQRYQLSRIEAYRDWARCCGVSASVNSGYVKADLATSYRYSPTVTITCNIQNLGNRFNSDAGSLFPTLGRQTFLGVSYRPRL